MTHGSGAGMSVYGGQLTMTAGTISGNKATGDTRNGGGINLSYSTGTISDGTISNNRAGASGGGISVSHSKLTISGGTVFQDTAKIGGGITSASIEDVITLSGGTVSNNIATNGADVRMAGGTLYVSGNTTISKNNSTVAADVKNVASGGGIYHNGEGGFPVTEAAQISQNTAANGGGIFIDQGTLAMTGGTISENAANYCGDIYIADNSVNIHNELSLTGGKITKNKSANNGGGIMNRGILSISGTPFVAENTKGGAYDADTVAFTGSEKPEANNVHLLSGKQITLSGPLSNGAAIGVTTQTNPTDAKPVPITTAETGTEYYKDAARYFIPDVAMVIAQANNSGK